jgi:hypothetical protein
MQCIQQRITWHQAHYSLLDMKPWSSQFDCMHIPSICSFVSKSSQQRILISKLDAAHVAWASSSFDLVPSLGLGWTQGITRWGWSAPLLLCKTWFPWCNGLEAKFLNKYSNSIQSFGGFFLNYSLPCSEAHLLLAHLIKKNLLKKIFTCSLRA